MKIFRHGPHHGEEPPVSGARGSGTVFFSHCTLKCMYCQNFAWSQEHRGATADVAELERMLRELHAAGCHNWNLVSPTPWLPWIREAVLRLRGDGISLPVVYNTSGYERVEVLRECHEWVDIYLTDLRYSRAETAREASGAADYVDAARAAFEEMWRAKGRLRCDDEGVAGSGVICRYLVLPGHAGEASENLRWTAEHIGTDAPVSVMSQYVPVYRAVQQPPWDRRLSRDEYEGVLAVAEELGFENGWLQDFDEQPVQGIAGFEMKEGRGEVGTPSQRRTECQ